MPGLEDLSLMDAKSIAVERGVVAEGPPDARPALRARCGEAVAVAFSVALAAAFSVAFSTARAVGGGGP
jgi:hypothetical protein